MKPNTGNMFEGNLALDIYDSDWLWFLPSIFFKTSTNSRTWRWPACTEKEFVLGFLFFLGVFNWQKHFETVLSWNVPIATNSKLCNWVWLSFLHHKTSNSSAIYCVCTQVKWNTVPKTSYRNNSSILCQIWYISSSIVFHAD